MKTFAMALLLAASPLAAQVCPREAPFPTSPIRTYQQAAEGSVAYIIAAGASECPPPPPGVSNGCGEQAYFIQSCDVVKWDFGDGTTQTETGSEQITHTFAHFGVYQVKAHITNALGSADSAGTVYVTRAPLTMIDAETVVRASETDGLVTVHATRSGDLSRSNRVDWHVESYEVGIAPATGTFTFAPGEAEHDVTFPITWDHRWSGSYECDLWLDGAADGALSARQQSLPQNVLTAILVEDAEPIPQGTLRDVTVSKGSTRVRVPLDLTNQFAFNPVAVTWAFFHTIDGSAHDGGDYTGTTGSAVTLEANTNRVYIEIPLRPNPAPGTRAFDVEIPPSMLPMLRRRATVTIVDDSIMADPAQVSLAAGSDAKLTLSGGTPLPVKLTSSDPGVVTVPPTATLPASVFLHAVAPGHATIKIDAGSGRTETVDVQVFAARRRAVR